MSKIKSFAKEWGTIITELVVCVSIIIGVVCVVNKYPIKKEEYKKAYYIRCYFNNDNSTSFYNNKYKIENGYIYIEPEDDEADLYMFSVDSCYIQFKEK